MKKLLFTASLLTVIAISAQETQERKRPERPTTEQQMKAFDDYNLSSAQKQKLQTLYKERDAKFEKNKPSQKDGERPQPPKDGQKPDDSKMKAQFEKENKEFDGKIQKILTKEQYTKYQTNQKQHSKDGQKKGGQRPERKQED